MTARYDGGGLTLDDAGITIPFATSKKVAYRDIKGIKTEQMGWASGKGRFGGASDPRYWFPLDIHRGSKTTLLILDVGRRVRPCMTPEDPDRVVELLKSRVPAS
ncbi:hypothetical protein F0Q45_09400 [Mycobacterium simiae]|uniref:Bacterial Pleckstrin homology domain-containing protein n=1 Tax=Mycobacterium simiae TaxID=1784 RepID=A0A5B1BSX7_MYCSI|nr:hypothetical protein [Mycobacterium simiae]KAA1250473.1 hypothetical protein F0Q45_09400 [Mycobacterium simiae]